jgi:predicted metal-dependent phosphoesterase TrpH
MTEQKEAGDTVLAALRRIESLLQQIVREQQRSRSSFVDELQSRYAAGFMRGPIDLSSMGAGSR